jgi:hypothetical protein
MVFRLCVQLSRSAQGTGKKAMLVRQVSGEVVPVPEEQEYFRLARVPWIAPEQRTADVLRQVARGHA